jgi:two-component system, chemotaxis family, sensor kinase CheA
MVLFNRLKVHSKLILLASVPVFGTLLISWLVVAEVQERAQAAAGLGSIEGLANLTDTMLYVVHELREERAEVTYSAGLPPVGSRGGAIRPREAAVRAQHERTDRALEALAGFLSDRDDARLPAKLREDLKAAREQLAGLGALRARAVAQQFQILEYLDFFARANDSLIGATAALTQLSSDKELTFSIGHLVSAMQVIERESREHALLNYVFGKEEFPPGTYRYLVTLLTEEEVYTASIRTWASEEDFARLQASLRGPHASRIEAMRKVALETTDEMLSVDAHEWFETQRDNLAELARKEGDMVNGVREVAARKVAGVQSATRLALGLVLGVIALSTWLGWAITRGLTRSVRVLSRAAVAVHENNDFSIRAEKTSSDELGLLTDAFNGMLAGIQERDRELGSHRKNLETLVEARTRQLSEQSRAMRLVLDNVEQGLSMLDRDGNILGESSRAFDAAFGTHPAGTPFSRILSPTDERKCCEFELGYEQLIAGVLPLELALQQMPSTFVRGGRHYAVSFTPVMGVDGPSTTLLATRDLTTELMARRAEAAQRERVQIFEHLMRDRIGFHQFLLEARRLMGQLHEASLLSDAGPRRALHTLKGLAATFDVSSVATAAHELESAVQDAPGDVPAALGKVQEAWDAFSSLVAPLLGDEDDGRIELTRNELEHVHTLVRRKASPELLEQAVIRLGQEPVIKNLQRIRQQLLRLARRRDKPEPRVVIDAADVRLPIGRYREFWSSLTHVVRNIVDHGLEDEAQRLAAGKALQNVILLRALCVEQSLHFEIKDDGRGIDWERLAHRAGQRGLPCASEEDLQRALFAEGVSTRDEATDTSGRGVGMSAVREACLALGGTLAVESTWGEGTLLSFVLPLASELRSFDPSASAQRTDSPDSHSTAPFDVDSLQPRAATRGASAGRV